MSFTKKLISGAVAMVILSVAAIGVNVYATDKMQVLSGQSFTPGTYTAAYEGFHGPVELSVTFSDEAITDVTVTAHEETEGIGSLAVAGLPGEIVETQSLDLDAVSGASFTSAAILDGVADTVAQAGGDPEAMGHAVSASSNTSQESASSSADEEDPYALVYSGDYNPGTYLAFVDGYSGDEMIVRVTLSEHAITGVEVTEHGEYDSIGTVAIAALPGRILEEQDTDIDVISGATLTSKAILAAVEDCLARAALE